MHRFVADDLTRAATFFTLAFGVATAGGLALGDVRLGLRVGLLLGLISGVFAYVFLVPTGGEP